MRSIVCWEDYAFLFRDALHREIKWTPFSAGMIKGVSSDLCDWCKQSQSLWTILVCVRLDAYLCLTLCDLMNYRSPGSSVHGISQARILEWVAISSSRESFQPQGSNPHLLSLLHCRRILYHWTNREYYLKDILTPSFTAFQILWIVHFYT